MKKLPLTLCASVLHILSCRLHCPEPAEGRLSQQPPRFLEIPADVLEDKIRGGMFAQVIGNLNGLPHEFKYINDPGHVEHFTPSLPKGAFTDDDTDIEWVYLREIAQQRRQYPSDRTDIAALWKRHINRRIFCR